MSLAQATPFASPGGRQLVTWLGQGPEVGLHLAERGGAGGPFGDPVTLSSAGNIEDPSFSFAPDDGLYAIWGVATGGAPAESIIRPAGGDFGPVQNVPGCQRFVDSAAGPNGEIAMACRFVLGTNPPHTVRWGVSPTLGPVTISEDLVPPAYANFLTPMVEVGPEGTVAIVSEGHTTTTNPPPANETKRVRVSLRSTTISVAADVAQTTWPDDVDAGPPVILEDGTVAVPLSGTAGARVIVRPPGPATSFTPLPLQGEGIWGMGSDESQNIHVASGISDDRDYSSFVKPADGGFSTGFPIPMPVIAGGGDAYLTGFKVAPDGTEYAVIRGDDGTYGTSREPGQSFSSPQKLGNSSAGNPDSAVTSDGDLLVTWAHENGASDRSVMFSGLDKTPPEVTIGSFPEQAEGGIPVTFAATATDAMGIQSTAWRFDGESVSGNDATRTFITPGIHQVSFTATDVAGQQTVVQKSLAILPGPDSKPLMTLKAPKRIRFGALKSRGVRIVVTGQPKVRIKAVLGTSKRNARLRPLVTKVVRKLRNRHVLRIRPKRARLGKRRSFRLYVQVTGTTAKGKRATKSRQVRIRR